MTLTCGYFAVPRKDITPEGYTHNWTAFVRSVKYQDGRDIRRVVEKVVFQLHKDYKPNQKRGTSILAFLLCTDNA